MISHLGQCLSASEDRADTDRQTDRYTHTHTVGGGEVYKNSLGVKTCLVEQVRFFGSLRLGDEKVSS